MKYVEIMRPLSEFAETIFTPRIELRTLNVCRENAEMIYNALDTSRDYIEAFQGFLEYIKSPDDVFDLMQKRNDQRATDKAICYGIFRNSEFIGRIRFERTDADSGYVGYWQTQPASGNGYMSEALSALEQELFNFGFNKIIIEIDDGNTRSENLARRNGYEFLARRPMASWAKCMGKCDELVYVKYKK